MSRTLDFHMRAFADPLPRPKVWSHNNVYPNFTVWGWQVASNRQQPGFTALENVSATGFRSSVREWLPHGKTMPQVKLTILSDGLYQRGRSYAVTIVRLRDGVMRRLTERPDGEGRLRFQLDGDEYEVGVSVAPQPVLALTDYRLEEGRWATAGMPVKMRARFYNKGTAASPARVVRWYSANAAIEIDTPTAILPAMAPGQSGEAPLAFLVQDQGREIVKLSAVAGDEKLPLEVPLFPPAQEAYDFKIGDGKAFTVYQQAMRKSSLVAGDGNGDGRANPGERVAILLPDGDVFRLAELYTNDDCVDNTTRLSDNWSSYDHVGASAKYSLPVIKPWCPAGHVVRFMARVQLPDKPNHKIRYAVVQFPVAAGAARLTKPVATPPPKLSPDPYGPTRK
jgi:hypothetical protein